MKDLFAPNRVAVMTALLGAVAAALATLLGAVDTTEKAIVVAVALISVAAVLVVYLLGSQRWEALTFRAATGTLGPPSTTVVNRTVTLDVDPPSPNAVPATPGAEWDDGDGAALGDPGDLTDEARQPLTTVAAMPTRTEHADLGDGDEPTDTASQDVTS